MAVNLFLDMGLLHVLEDLLVPIREDEALIACQRLPAPLATMRRLFEGRAYQSDRLDPGVQHRKRAEHSMELVERLIRRVDGLVADALVVSRLHAIGQVPANETSIADVLGVVPQLGADLVKDLVRQECQS